MAFQITRISTAYSTVYPEEATLQWHHMNIMASQMTRMSSVYSIVYPEEATLQWRHMNITAFQITRIATVYYTVYPEANQRQRQSSESRTFVRGIHWWPVDSLNKGPVTRKMFPFHDVIMDATGTTQLQLLSVSKVFASIAALWKYTTEHQCRVVN